MKRYLQAAFKITLFQIVIIVLFSTLKYVLITYNLVDKIQKPFIWTCFIAGIIFVLAVTGFGVIKNRGKSYESWQSNPQKSGKERILDAFITWGMAIPPAFAYVLLIYMIAPTSLSLFVALYAGIVIRNSIDFFKKPGIAE